jgi:hypothetical protein
MNTFPRLYKIFGLIYLFLTDVMTGKEWEDSDDGNDYVVEVGVDFDHYYYYKNSSNNKHDVPIVDELAVEKQPEEQLKEQVQHVEVLTQQQEEEEATVTAFLNDDDDFYYSDHDDDDNDDEDGSDFYFSLPSIIASVNAVDLFTAMRGTEDEAEDDISSYATEEVRAQEDDSAQVDASKNENEYVVEQGLTTTEVAIAADGVTEDAEASMSGDFHFGDAEVEVQDDDSMQVEASNDPDEDAVEQELTDTEVVIVTENVTVDVKASMSVDEPENYHQITTVDSAVLGSIWVPHPKHGLVRRSARLRVRG